MLNALCYTSVDLSQRDLKKIYILLFVYIVLFVFNAALTNEY